MLFLTKSDYEKMLAHCKEGLPNEACGLIGGVVEGEKQYVKKVYLLTNMDESNEHFSMDPKEQLAAVKDFHSHPESPSRPSEEDKRLAYDSKANYLILSLMEADNPVLNAFRVDEEKQVTKEELVIS